MIELNSQNGSDRILRFIQNLLMKDFPDDHLVGVEMGIAYGGGIEALFASGLGHLRIHRRPLVILAAGGGGQVGCFSGLLRSHLPGLVLREIRAGPVVSRLHK